MKFIEVLSAPQKNGGVVTKDDGDSFPWFDQHRFLPLRLFRAMAWPFRSLRPATPPISLHIWSIFHLRLNVPVLDCARMQCQTWSKNYRKTRLLIIIFQLTYLKITIFTSDRHHVDPYWIYWHSCNHLDFKREILFRFLTGKLCPLSMLSKTRRFTSAKIGKNHPTSESEQKEHPNIPDPHAENSPADVPHRGNTWPSKALIVGVVYRVYPWS